SGQGQIQRVRQTDPARKSLRPAGAGNQSELHLRQAENCPGMIRSDPISTSKRGLSAAAQACAMDCGDNKDAQPRDGVEEHLAVATQSLRIRRGLQLLKLFNVSTGDPYV